jgi:hypothetical protein
MALRRGSVVLTVVDAVNHVLGLGVKGHELGLVLLEDALLLLC